MIVRCRCRCFFLCFRRCLLCFFVYRINRDFLFCCFTHRIIRDRLFRGKDQHVFSCSGGGIDDFSQGCILRECLIPLRKKSGFQFGGIHLLIIDSVVDQILSGNHLTGGHADGSPCSGIGLTQRRLAGGYNTADDSNTCEDHQPGRQFASG